LGIVRAGAGAPVVLVHGTMGAKEDWAEVARRLSTDFSVITFDRRGRGTSGDGAGYDLEREVEDVFAVVDDAGPPVHLVGHSFGAVLALLVAAQAGGDGRLASLVVYEPPVGDVQPASDHDWLDDLDQAVVDGDLDTAVQLFSAAAGLTDEEVQANRANDRVWAALRDGVHTAGREIRAAKAVLPLDDSLLASIAVPTLVLLGADQEHGTYSGVADLAARVPDGRLERVPGRHLANVLAPDAFAATVRAFFASAPRAGRGF
jgi:pimeloyl-ACP methyl ester carboxylesterase